jgi:AcrR family transcriptional regulator
MAEFKAGWRQRKKLKTRRALADAATRLFAERGYEETTIADLAAAAEIAPRTFFSYFPAKEDVLFADLDDRTAALSELELRQTGETLPDGLRRVAREIVEKLVEDPEREEAHIRLRIIASRPSLQAAALLRQRAAERVLARRLADSYKDQLDLVEAAAVVGAFTAALRAAAGETGSDLSVRGVRRVVARVSHLLEHGLRPGNGRSAA